VIINGTLIAFRLCEGLDEAKEYALRICDCSKEIIIREITEFYGLKVLTNEDNWV
jgi:hypothetical protein